MLIPTEMNGTIARLLVLNLVMLCCICIATNLPIVTALSRTTVIPNRLRRLLLIMSVTIIAQAMAALANSLISFILSATSLLARKNDEQSQGLLILPILSVWIQMAIEVAMQCTSKLPAMRTSFVECVVSAALFPTAITSSLIIPIEIVVIVSYYLVLRSNKRELIKFNRAGHHQSLSVRISLKQTSQISHVLLLSVIGQVIIYLVFVVVVSLPLNMIFSEHLHSMLHPILIVKRFPPLRAQVQKLGLLGYLNCVSVPRFAVNKVGPVLDLGDRYMMDLEHVWNTVYHERLQEANDIRQSSGNDQADNQQPSTSNVQITV